MKYLLEETDYPQHKIDILVNGFREGFDLGYRGPEDVRLTSPNLKFTVGNSLELWNKVMKEVAAKRYAGPYENIPFRNYIQSPIGLVPKDGNKTRLIFHLSYPRGTDKSVNANTPEELSEVHYQQFEDAVRLCLVAGRSCFGAKSDLSSAFRHLAIHKKFWKYLVLKAKDPETNKWFYFIDKCLPFGASISCALFQSFSDALSHIIMVKSGFCNINYLDDFFFVAAIQWACDGQVRLFLQVCERIAFPVSLEKTVWGGMLITFLGLLLDTANQAIRIPVDKITRAIDMINYFLNKPSKRITLRELQSLCGFLNFLCKAIVPGRVFVRRLYSHGGHLKKPGHHLPVTKEMRLDLSAWLMFLQTPCAYSRPFFDFQQGGNTSEKIELATDASANPELGAGGVCYDRWFILQWDEEFIIDNKPSINYLELYAVTVAVYNWIHLFANRRVTLFCDNMSAVWMLNTTSSKCKNCMVLLRLIVLQCMTHNVRLSATYVSSKDNLYPDLLSRMRYREFRKQSKLNNRKFKNNQDGVPHELWPMNKLWW